MTKTELLFTVIREQKSKQNFLRNLKYRNSCYCKLCHRYAGTRDYDISNDPTHRSILKLVLTHCIYNYV